MFEIGDVQLPVLFSLTVQDLSVAMIKHGPKALTIRCRETQYTALTQKKTKQKPLVVTNEVQLNQYLIKSPLTPVIFVRRNVYCSSQSWCSCALKVIIMRTSPAVLTNPALCTMVLKNSHQTR